MRLLAQAITRVALNESQINLVVPWHARAGDVIQWRWRPGFIEWRWLRGNHAIDRRDRPPVPAGNEYHRRQLARRRRR